MAKDLVGVLQDLKQKVEKAYPPGKKRDAYQQNFERLIKEYDGLEVPEYVAETYTSLIKRGTELQKENKIKDEKLLQYYQRYCDAALFDFKDNIKPLNWIVRSYVVMCMLFMLLAPQYYPWVLPVVMIIPIFMGLRGMKKRTHNGLMMGNSVVPLGFLISITWIKNTSLAMNDYSSYVQGVAAQYGMPVDAAGSMLTMFSFFSVILFAASALTAFFSYKYRRMFV